MQDGLVGSNVEFQDGHQAFLISIGSSRLGPLILIKQIFFVSAPRPNMWVDVYFQMAILKIQFCEWWHGVFIFWEVQGTNLIGHGGYTGVNLIHGLSFFSQERLKFNVCFLKPRH